MQKTDTYHHTYSLTFPKYGIFIFPNTKNISLEDMLLLRNLYETYTHQKRTTYTAFEGNGFLFILQDTIDTIEDKIAHLSKTEFKEKAIRIYCTPHIATSHAIEPIFKEALTFIDILEKIPSLPFITMLADHTILSILLATPKETSITFMKSQLAPFFTKNNPNNELIETLDTLIKTQFNKHETAKQLYVHYNTIRYRIQQLQQLGFNLNSSPANIASLSFALAVYKYIYLPK